MASVQLFYLNPEPCPAQRSAHGVRFRSMAPPVTAVYSSFDLGFLSCAHHLETCKSKHQFEDMLSSHVNN